MPPKKTRARLQVIKIPLDYLPVIHPPAFPPMPRLYLELLENKKKVKPELRNIEYISDNINNTQTPSLTDAENVADKNITEEENIPKILPPSIIPSQTRKATKQPRKGPLKIIDVSEMSQEEISQLSISKAIPSISPNLLTEGFPKAGKSLDTAFQNMRLLANNQTARDNNEENKSQQDFINRDINKSRRHEDSFGRRDEDRSNRRDGDRSNRRNEDSFDEDSFGRHNEGKSRRKDEDKYNEHRSSRHDDDRSSRRDDDRSSRRDEIRKSRRDKDIHEGKSGREEDKSVREEYKSGEEVDNVSRGKYIPTLEDIMRGKESVTNIEKKIPIITGPILPNTVRVSIAPSLEEIQSGRPQMDDKTGFRKMEYVTKEEDHEAGKKRDILFKFKILKRTYKDATVPDFTEYTDIKTLEREYDSIVRQLSLDATVENYRKYLTIGFFALEFVMSNFFKFEEIRGFAQQQLLGMNQYERILYTIGEKSHLSGKKAMSPEIQLVGLIILNGAVFVGSKMLFKATGANIMAMLNPTNASSTSANTSQQPTPASKPKMKGPDIDLFNLTGKKGN
jgi:hypothetical protein